MSRRATLGAISPWDTSGGQTARFQHTASRVQCLMYVGLEKIIWLF